MKNCIALILMLVCGAAFAAEAGDFFLGSEEVSALSFRTDLGEQQVSVTAPSNCQGGTCKECKCPGDGRCIAGECEKKETPKQTTPDPYFISFDTSEAPVVAKDFVTENPVRSTEQFMTSAPACADGSCGVAAPAATHYYRTGPLRRVWRAGPVRGFFRNGGFFRRGRGGC